MGTTAYVREYGGTVLLRGQLEMTGLVRSANRLALPFLGNVDEFDDTIFNRLQLRVVGAELDEISRTSSDFGAEVRELEDLVSLVQERPHRFLVFNGD
ncbi:MAG: hypothetical protein FWF90_02940 [Promicromonosporaceae bacterium]|nr:hypothetical protein [Promicromonosporaceae bacterium]